MRITVIFAAALTLSTLGGEATLGGGEVQANPLRDFDKGTTDGLARASSGLFYGATMGRGSLAVSCDSCRERPRLSEGLSVTGHAGLKVGSRLGFYGEYWMIRWSDRDGDWFDDSDIHSITQQTISAGAQFWVTRRLFLRASLGYGRHSTDIDYTKREDVLFRAEGAAPVPLRETDDGDASSGSVATTIGAGFEIVRTRGFGLSLELRASHNRLDSRERDVSSYAASVGLSWF